MRQFRFGITRSSLLTGGTLLSIYVLESFLYQILIYVYVSELFFDKFQLIQVIDDTLA